MYRGTMSWRRLRVLIQHLPPESATMTAIRNATPESELTKAAERADPSEGRWSQQEQLMASLLDVVRQLLHAFVVANSSGKGKKPPLPEPTPRPGVKAKGRRQAAAPSEAAAETLFKLINGGAV